MRRAEAGAEQSTLFIANNIKQMGSLIFAIFPRVEVPLTSSSTSEEKWRTGRWSPGGLEEKRKRIFPFLKQPFFRSFDLVFKK